MFNDGALKHSVIINRARNPTAGERRARDEEKGWRIPLDL